MQKFAGNDQDPVAAGRELGVEVVLDGHVQRLGDTIRVTVQLVSVKDGAQLWTGKFDGQYRGIFAVQDSISNQVAQAMAPNLTGEERGFLTKLVGHSNCKPPASADVDWIDIIEVDFNPDNMVFIVIYSVEPNIDPGPRFGSIKVGDKYQNVNQAGKKDLPAVNTTPRTIPSGGPGIKLRVNPGGSDGSSTITIEAAGFSGNSIVGWDGEERPTTLVSATELSADISADDIATPGTVRVTVFDPSPGGGTSPDVTFTITQGPDFTLGFDQPTVTAQAGTKARVTVNITRTGGFAGNVTITPPDPVGGIKAKPADPITTTDASASFKMKIGGALRPDSISLSSPARTTSVGRARQRSPWWCSRSRISVVSSAG